MLWTKTQRHWMREDNERELWQSKDVSTMKKESWMLSAIILSSLHFIQSAWFPHQGRSRYKSHRSRRNNNWLKEEQLSTSEMATWFHDGTARRNATGRWEHATHSIPAIFAEFECPPSHTYPDCDKDDSAERARQCMSQHIILQRLATQEKNAEDWNSDKKIPKWVMYHLTLCQHATKRSRSSETKIKLRRNAPLLRRSGRELTKRESMSCHKEATGNLNKEMSSDEDDGEDRLDAEDPSHVRRT